MAFRDNPCRRTAFDTFALDKAETDLKTIRRAIGNGRSANAAGGIVDQDGARWQVDAAQLNILEDQITVPLQRLRLEQFVHQPHVFTLDDPIREPMGEIAGALRWTDIPEEVMDILRAALAERLARRLPEPQPVPPPDQLPWPDVPQPSAVPLESFEHTILRDR